MKHLAKPETNLWKNGVIVLVLLMLGMYMGQAFTGHQLRELKVSIAKSVVTQPSAEGKAPGQ